MKIEEVFEINTPDGDVVPVITGRISSGRIYVGDEIEVSDANKNTFYGEVTHIEMFRKFLDQAEEGDNVGLLIRGINGSDLKPGMIVSYKNSDYNDAAMMAACCCI